MSTSVPHVLFADDDDLVRLAGRALLRSVGARVSVAGDLDELWSSLVRAREEGEPVDLVILDVQFGPLSGLDVCRKLRAEGVDVPIVAISGDVLAFSVEEYAEAGFDDVLSKPVSRDQLAACTERFVGRKHARLERFSWS